MERVLLWVIAAEIIVMLIFVQRGFNEVIKALEAVHSKLGKGTPEK